MSMKLVPCMSAMINHSSAPMKVASEELLETASHAADSGTTQKESTMAENIRQLLTVMLVVFQSCQVDQGGQGHRVTWLGQE